MRNEPALTIGVVAAAIVALASIFNVVIDLNTVQTILVAVVPLVSALITRFNVIPVAKAPLNAPLE